MSSSFAELYSDFQDKVKAYTEKLDITEFSFMRLYTRGMQTFQRETEYIEKTVDIQRGVPPDAPIFIVPDDMLRIVDVRGLTNTACGVQEEIMLLQDYEQFIRNKDKWDGGYLETPTDYGMRIPYKRTVSAGRGNQIRLATIWQRELITFPEFEGDTLTIWYIPDIHAISNLSSQWASWFPYDTNFLNQFRSTTLNPSIAQFEKAFLDYAVSEYIQSKGSANYKVFEANFNAAVVRAIETKPTLYREGTTSYMFAPWS